MKTKLLYVFFSMIFSCAFAQVDEKVIYQSLNNEFSEVVQARIEDKQIQNASSNIFIQQIGNNNLVSTKLTSFEGSLNVSQHGDFNSMDFITSSKSTTGNFKQAGNNNYSFAFTHEPQEQIKYDLSQTGNNLHFESHGTNSISDNLKFNMNGDYNSIIVRNFK